MNRVFRPRGFFQVPDGTDVSPFLNATDTNQQDVPWDALGEMGIAAGRIAAGINSWIHVHPALTQVTYLLSGSLGIRMRDEGAGKPYDLLLEAGEAVITEPGTLFQLRNSSVRTVDVLYIVSPSYVFEMDGDRLVYDDAILVAKSWRELEQAEQNGPYEVSRYEATASRAESIRRLAVRKGIRPMTLREEPIRPLPEACDYVAPDGSEIRLLANCECGGMAHCVLPAGRISAPIHHRTIEELWYVLSGEGEIWRGRENDERIDVIEAGDSVRIPVGFSFQLRASAGEDLKLLLVTIPPSPGPQEAVPTAGPWNPT